MAKQETVVQRRADQEKIGKKIKVMREVRELRYGKLFAAMAVLAVWPLSSVPAGDDPDWYGDVSGYFGEEQQANMDLAKPPLQEPVEAVAGTSRSQRRDAAQPVSWYEQVNGFFGGPQVSTSPTAEEPRLPAQRQQQIVRTANPSWYSKVSDFFADEDIRAVEPHRDVAKATQARQGLPETKRLDLPTPETAQLLRSGEVTRPETGSQDLLRPPARYMTPPTAAFEPEVDVFDGRRPQQSVHAIQRAVPLTDPFANDVFEHGEEVIIHQDLFDDGSGAVITRHLHSEEADQVLGSQLQPQSQSISRDTVRDMDVRTASMDVYEPLNLVEEISEERRRLGQSVAAGRTQSAPSSPQRMVLNTDWVGDKRRATPQDAASGLSSGALVNMADLQPTSAPMVSQDPEFSGLLADGGVGELPEFSGLSRIDDDIPHAQTEIAQNDFVSTAEPRRLIPSLGTDQYGVVIPGTATGSPARDLPHDMQAIAAAATPISDPFAAPMPRPTPRPAFASTNVARSGSAAKPAWLEKNWTFAEVADEPAGRLAGVMPSQSLRAPQPIEQQVAANPDYRPDYESNYAEDYTTGFQPALNPALEENAYIGGGVQSPLAPLLIEQPRYVAKVDAYRDAYDPAMGRHEALARATSADAGSQNATWEEPTWEQATWEEDEYVLNTAPQRLAREDLSPESLPGMQDERFRRNPFLVADRAYDDLRDIRSNDDEFVGLRDVLAEADVPMDRFDTDLGDIRRLQDAVEPLSEPLLTAEAVSRDTLVKEAKREILAELGVDSLEELKGSLQSAQSSQAQQKEVAPQPKNYRASLVNRDGLRGSESSDGEPRQMAAAQPESQPDPNMDLKYFDVPNRPQRVALQPYLHVNPYAAPSAFDISRSQAQPNHRGRVHMSRAPRVYNHYVQPHTFAPHSASSGYYGYNPSVAPQLRYPLQRAPQNYQGYQQNSHVMWPQGEQGGQNTASDSAVPSHVRTLNDLGYGAFAVATRQLAYPNRTASRVNAAAQPSPEKDDVVEQSLTLDNSLQMMPLNGSTSVGLGVEFTPDAGPMTLPPADYGRGYGRGYRTGYGSPQQLTPQPLQALPAMPPGSMPGQALGQMPRQARDGAALLDELEARILDRPSLNKPVAVLFFRDGSSGLNSRDRQVLSSVAQLHRKAGGKIYLEGHASRRTKDMPIQEQKLVNYEFSLKRIEAVKQALVRQGIPASDILLEARGHREPQYLEVMPRGEAWNRRVEIYVQ